MKSGGLSAPSARSPAKMELVCRLERASAKKAGQGSSATTATNDEETPRGCPTDKSDHITGADLGIFVRDQIQIHSVDKFVICDNFDAIIKFVFSLELTLNRVGVKYDDDSFRDDDHRFVLNYVAVST